VVLIWFEVVPELNSDSLTHAQLEAAEAIKLSCGANWTIES